MKTEKEKMLSGENYTPLDYELQKERRRAKNLLHRLNITEYRITAKARLLIEELVPNSGKNFYIEPPFYCEYGYNIICGDNVYLNTNCTILDAAQVEIGNDVLIGPNVQIYTATHPLDARERKQTAIAKSIQIGNNCWIGGGAILCPDVSIGHGSVVGAGAVVTKNVPENTVVAGNPAKVIRNLEQ